MRVLLVVAFLLQLRESGAVRAGAHEDAVQRPSARQIVLTIRQEAPTAAESGCEVNLTANDTVQQEVISDSSRVCWNFTATRGRDVLLVVENSTVDCSRRGALEIFTEGRRIPDICRRLQSRTVAQPLWGSSIAVRYRPPSNRTAAEAVRLRYRARGDVEKIRVQVWSPVQRSFIAMETIPLAGNERTWRDVRRKAKRLISSRIDGDAVAAQFGWLYRRGRVVRRYIFSTRGYRDEVHGRRPSLWENRSFLHFLLPDSPIRSCPRCEPYLLVYLSARVATVAAANPPRLQDTDVASLRDPNFVLLLAALEMTDRRSRGAAPGSEMSNASKVFIKTVDGYTDGDTGRHFSDANSAVAAQTLPRREQKWSQLFIVLRQGDPVPQFNVVGSVMAYVRFGVELEVQKGRLRQRGRATPRDGTWAWPQSRSTIAQQVTRAMWR